MNVKELSKIIKHTFPKIEFAIAYGSAAIPQKNHPGKMLDMIFVVKDTKNFHNSNLGLNKPHYSLLARMLGGNLTSRVNETGTGVYYNPRITLANGQFIKYGVISVDKAFKYLDNWDNLFFAGRMQKPTLLISGSDDEALQKQYDELIQRNIKRALSLTLLKLEKPYIKEKIYQRIVEISYRGDFRNYVKAENKKKTENVVLGSLELYDNLYLNLMTSMGIEADLGATVTSPGKFEDSLKAKIYDKEFLRICFNDLPNTFKYDLLNYHRGQLSSSIDTLEELRECLIEEKPKTRKKLINGYIDSMNLRYSVCALLSAGYSTNINKSFRYVLEKYKKSRK